jgi:S-formylglutathione hydrolase FrmB
VPSPDSTLLLVLLCASPVALLVVASRRRRPWSQLVAGGVSLLLAFAGGVAAVNHHYGYYRTWGDLVTDLRGGPDVRHLALGAPGSAGLLTPGPSGGQRAARGELVKVDLAGLRRHLDRQALVWLPPEYFQPGRRTTRFPVLELLHGYPGHPSDWLTALHLPQLLGQLEAQGRIGPMVVVMPAINPDGARSSQECADAPHGAQDDTYLSLDVPDAITQTFRVLPTGPGWAVGGFSTGAYCAAVLALRHPGTFHAVAALDGYLNPVQGGFATTLFGRDQHAERGYDIAALLMQRQGQPGPLLPSFYLVAGTKYREDLANSRTLQTLLTDRSAVDLVVAQGGGHDFYEWSRALPATLAWVWGQIGATLASSPAP